MIRVYIAAGVLTAVLGAYVAGARFGRADCARDVAHDGVAVGVAIIQEMEKTDAAVFNTGVYDIRRILRAQYTIAD